MSEDPLRIRESDPLMKSFILFITREEHRTRLVKHSFNYTKSQPRSFGATTVPVYATIWPYPE